MVAAEFQPAAWSSACTSFSAAARVVTELDARWMSRESCDQPGAALRPEPMSRLITQEEPDAIADAAAEAAAVSVAARHNVGAQTRN